MRVNKLINGESFIFNVIFIFDKMKANVKCFHGDMWVECPITDDFKYILLPDGEFKFNNKDVKKLKLSKHQMYDAMDYNSRKK